MAKVVLDASALLAVLLHGPLTVYLSLIFDDAAMSAVNACEVATKLVERGMAGQQAVALIPELSVSIESFTAEDTITAADLRMQTRGQGLSLGDRACLALGLRLAVPVYTADRPWMRLDLPIGIKLVR